MGIKHNMKIFSGLITGLFLFFAGPTRGLAQTQDSLKYHIAVFLPLYLDSAFDASGNYRFDQNFPKYLNPGLEFYEGLELAMDSLKKSGAPLDITVYDTRSETKSLPQILEDSAFTKMQMIVGHVTASEL